MNPALLSSVKHDYGTPRDLFERYSRIYRFTLDVCATAENAKCKRYFTPEQDGLAQPWSGRCWMNPPYGREIGKWVNKAFVSTAMHEADVVVCLLPARTDTQWFHQWCKQAQVEFLEGRIQFDGATGPAPFPSMIVVFK